MTSIENKVAALSVAVAYVGSFFVDVCPTPSFQTYVSVFYVVGAVEGFRFTFVY